MTPRIVYVIGRKIQRFLCVILSVNSLPALQLDNKNINQTARSFYNLIANVSVNSLSALQLDSKQSDNFVNASDRSGSNAASPILDNFASIPDRLRSSAAFLTSDGFLSAFDCSKSDAASFMMLKRWRSKAMLYALNKRLNLIIFTYENF